ncbi:LPP20 lipoprotein [Hydrogenivirga caldilitoris]|uniref:LPP20 lipoprotein n=1 Tax=Hydrogenivirga caldilitoris TaxID=246264 RepID=A0A497XNT2_9AQUI|nr:LPP20 family lipoprotein [Hydrogenivirga caldilitoris]RLJ70626.1 LPP20 lipoprotein [Hydrogenivirga caldilitoris]
MKRTLAFSLAGLVSVALISSCGGKKEVATGFEGDPCLKDAPAWVLNPQVEGSKVAAVGSAKIGKAGLQFARTEALANARDELARMIEIRVKNMVKNFMQVTGVGDAETVDRVSVQVSKQVAYQTIRGSKQVAIWQSPCAELFVLVGVDPQMVKDFIKTQVETSLRNEQALWQLYQAKKAHEELDKEIEKEFKGGQ